MVTKEEIAQNKQFLLLSPYFPQYLIIVLLFKGSLLQSCCMRESVNATFTLGHDVYDVHDSKISWSSTIYCISFSFSMFCYAFLRSQLVLLRSVTFCYKANMFCHIPLGYVKISHDHGLLLRSPAIYAHDLSKISTLAA